MVWPARVPRKLRQAEHEDEDEHEPDERHVRGEHDVVRPLPAAPQTGPSPTADARQLARSPRALPRARRARACCARGRGIVRAGTGARPRRRGRSRSAAFQNWTTTSRQPAVGSANGVLSPSVEDDTDPPLDLAREEAPRAETGRGRRSSWRRGPPAAAAATRSPRPAQRRREHARVEGREEVRQGPVGQPGEAEPAPRDRCAQVERGGAGAFEPRRVVGAGRSEHRAGDVDDEQRLDVGAHPAPALATDRGLRSREPEGTAGCGEEE